MDRKDPTRFDDTHKHPNSNEKISEQANQKLPSSDFWASRGNMGEKINILIGLNLQLLSLVSSLVQALSKEAAITEDMITSINKISKNNWNFSRFYYFNT